MKKILSIFFSLISVLAIAQSTDTQLTTQANVIRNETQPAANTPLRVGNMFRALIDSKKNLDDVYKSAGSSNTYTITINPGVLNFNSDFGFFWKVNTGNTGAVTLNPNGLGAKSVRKNFSSTLSSGDLTAGQVYPVVYDTEAGYFQIMLPGSGGGGGSTTVTDGNGTTGNGSAADLGGTLNQNTSIAGAGIYSLSLGTSGSRLSTFTGEIVGSSVWRTFSGNMSFRAGDNYGFFSDLRTMLIYNGSSTPSYTGVNQNTALWIKPSFNNFGSGTEFTALIQLPGTSTTFLNNVSSPAEGQFAYDSDENRPFWYDGTAWKYVASMDDITGGGSGSVNDSTRVRDEASDTYTVVQDDHQYWIRLSNTDPITIELDDALEVNTIIHFRRLSGAGVVTFVSNGTSVLDYPGGSATLETDQATASWIKVDAVTFEGVGQFGPASSGGGDITTGTTTITGGTNTKVLYNNSGVVGEYTVSGSGNVAMTTSPVFTTPNIGTPSAGTLTNTTGFPVANLAGAGSGILTWLATPSSANFASAITDEVGSGSVVLSDQSKNRQTASYVLVLSDKYKLVEMNVATSNTLTVPANSSVAFPIGSIISVTQYGVGVTTIVAGGGVTIRSSAGVLTSPQQYAPMVLQKIDTDEWYLWNGSPAIAPAALTRTDDTNVTMTLGGSAATALLNATSMTLGWSGQLSIARGGTGTANPFVRSLYRAVTATATLATTDWMLTADATGGAITVNLPAVSGIADGYTFLVVRLNSGANAVTLDGNGSETINGATTFALSSQYAYAWVVKVSTGWIIIGN